MLIHFNDSCVISRPTGTSDEWDNPVVTTVYEGPCLYEEKTTTSYPSGVVTRTPLLFIPRGEYLIEINDAVSVTTSNGRVENAVVRLVRDINITGMECERIELKQSQGD